MKTIIAALDFSTASLNAANYAANMAIYAANTAKAIYAALLLLHVGLRGSPSSVIKCRIEKMIGAK